MKSVLYFSRFSILLCFLTTFFALQGCKPRLLPSTNINATRENKQIVAFLERYKAAVEKRSVDSVMELVAKDFSDNMGTDDPALHLDYLGLKEKLEKYFPRILDIRLGLFVQHVAKLRKDEYEVVFYFNKNILTEVPSGEKWIAIKEVSRMVIRRTHGKQAQAAFEIVQGI